MDLTHGERKWRLVASPQAQNLRCPHVDEGGLVRDIKDRRLVEELASDRTDRLLRQAQVACASWSGRTLIRNRGGDR